MLKDTYYNLLISVIWQKDKSLYRWMILYGLLAFGGSGYGQVSGYTFSQSAGTYTSIGTGTTVHASGWDDAISTISIPFSFVFNGISYTSCSVNTNGYITFGATTSSTTGYTPISATTGYAGAISAMGRDMVSNASTIVYGTTGTTPNRVFVVQWNNARRYSGASRAADFNFQIRLSEATNVVSIVYGSCVSSYATAITVQVGLRGATNADRNNRMTTTSWAATTAGTANTSTCTTSNTVVPPSGRTFTFTPPTATHRYYMYNLNAGSTTWCAGETRNVSVDIKNTGTATWTNASPDINVGIKWNTNGTIWDDYYIRTDAGSVAPGASATYTFTIQAKNATAGPTYGTNLATGTNNLTFDMVSEGNCWLGNNPGACGAGYTATMNSRLVSPNQTIVAALACATTSLVPANAATGVCYGGGGAVTAISWGAVSGATGYDVYFGTSSTPPLVSSNQAGLSYNTGTLSVSTTYYWKIVPKSGCGDATGCSTYSFTTAANPCYCTPTYTNLCSSSDFINLVSTTGGSTNISNTASGCSGAANNYSLHTATSLSVQQGSSFTLNLQSGSAFGQGFGVWIDYNQNGTFETTEYVYSTASSTALNTTSITVPIAAPLGATRMRVRCAYSATPANTDACTNLSYGETEDYNVTIAAIPTCSGTPTAGTISANTSICSANTTSFSVTGASTGLGITYQWQQSANGSTGWASVTGGTGATTTSYTTPALTTTTYYRLAVTCTNSSTTSYTSAASATVTACCSYTFRLTDAYGDGWNGATMELRQGTTVLTTLGSTFTAGSSLDIPYTLTSGIAYNLYYVGGGSFPSEVGIQILDPTGAVIYTLPAGTGTVASQLTLWTANCPVPCSGTPTAGTASASPSTVCSGSTTTLTLTGQTNALNIAYQWQSSPSGANSWTNISGAISSTYTSGVLTSDIDYRCVVTCTNSSLFANSNTVAITVATAGSAGATQGNPVVVGDITCLTNTYSDVKNNACYGNDYIGQSSADIYYQFTLTQTRSVRISHCGSGFDTYVTLINSSGTVIASNDDSGPACALTTASIDATNLAAGDYYVISEGFSSNTGNINTQISLIGFALPSGGTIAGVTAACNGQTGLIYTISGVSNVTSYAWTVPAGATITAGQGTNSITVTWGSNPGNVSCTPINSGCNGTTVNYAVTLNTPSTAPTSITGTTTICQGASTTLTTSGGTLGTDAENIWYSGACGVDAFTQEWATNQPYSAPSTTVNSQTNGILNVTSTSIDPMIDMSGLGSFNPSTYKYVNIRYKVTAGIAGTAEIFFYNGSHNFAVGGESVAGVLVSDNTWRMLSIDMTADPDYTTGGNILGWRFDWASASGVTMDIDFISLSDQPIIGEGTSITVSPTTATTYYTTKKGACNTTTCSSVTVNINSLSVAPTGATGTTTICAGASTMLTVAGGTMGTGAVVEWFTASCGGTNAGTGASITVSPTTTTTYYVRYNGTCNTTTCGTVTVTVNPLHTVTLSSGSNTQTVCENVAIANIVYAVGGGATGLTVSGLPAGVGLTGLTISGTPTVGGTYNYTVSTTGNACPAVVATGIITVNSLVDYANLQFPTTGTICPSGSQTIYGQLYEPGVTPGAGAQGAGVVAQYGYSSTNTHPNTWMTWTNATFNAAGGGTNNDEYQGTLSGLSTGTYYYAFRYSLNGCAYQYGGTNGFWNGTTNVSGVLTVEPNHTIALSSAAPTTSQTICQNVAITNITYTLGGGATGANVTGLPSGVNASVVGTTLTISGAPSVDGTFNYSITTTGNACTVATANGTITVKSLLDYVNLQFPSSGAICQNGSFTAYGQVYEFGLTPAAGVGAGIVAEIGYSTSNSNPSTWTNWASATFNSQQSNNDEFVATFGSSLAAGTYYYTFRYSLNGCQWQYGGFPNGAWNGSTQNSGILTINPLPSALTCKIDDSCQKSLGQITVNMSGGTTPYTITYSPSATPASPIITSAASAVITGLTGGQSYNFTVSDANGCAAP